MNKDTNDNDVYRNEHHPLNGVWAIASIVIHQERNHEDTKVQSREIVMQIGDTTHDEEGDIMEEPAKEESLTSIEIVIPLSFT